MNSRVCTRCIADKTVKHISFDSEGVCSFCRDYDKIEAQLHDYERLSRLYSARIARAGGFSYDAAVGFSGGKDSSYVLAKAVLEDGLKVKAFTLDNGFLSAEAKNQIDRIVSVLKVDHEYVTFERELLQEVFGYTVKKYLSPCLACSFLGYAVMINYASKVNAKICLHGRSVPQMLRAYRVGSNDVVQAFMESGLKEQGETDLDGLYARAIENIKQHVSRRIGGYLGELTADGREKGFREFVAYFLYHPYDKSEVTEYIRKALNWRYTQDEEHFDCSIHNAAMYVKNIAARRAHILPEACVSVREGRLTRAEAAELCEKSLIAYPKEEMERMCGFLKVSKRALLLKARLYAKRWW